MLVEMAGDDRGGDFIVAVTDTPIEVACDAQPDQRRIKIRVKSLTAAARSSCRAVQGIVQASIGS